MNELLWWVFYFVGYLMDWCGLSLEDAVRQACGEMNVVLLRHNEAVRDVERGVTRKYWVDTHDLSDNQCNLLTQLSSTEVYRFVATPDKLILHGSERGSALEGFAAIVMLMIIVGIAVYLFVWPFVSVAVNFSDIISGIH